MWSNLPDDILVNIFSFLSPESLAFVHLACRNWHVCARACLLVRPQAAWFVALPSRIRDPCCYVHNPNTRNWHFISLDGLQEPVRPVASIGGLILLKPATSTILQLSVCNPFTGQVKNLPLFNRPRTNPALGIITLDQPNNSVPSFRVYMAGGTAEAPCRGGMLYESTLEMYDSREDQWQVVGSMPVEFAVRLTVWTPNESVHSDGVLYWMTSARAYSIMGFEIEAGRWHELSVPLADRLEFAALIRWEGKLALVGAVSGEAACAWELGEGGVWGLIGTVPLELGRRLVGEKLSWGKTKCVGTDRAVYLYMDLGSGMVAWRKMEEKGRWEWFWVDGCCAIKGKKVQNFAVRGSLLQPNLASSCFLK